MTKSSILVCSIMLLVSCSSKSETPVDALTDTEKNINLEGVASEKELQKVENAPLSFYQRISLLEGKLSVSIPASFAEMSADRIALKYPNTGNRPNVVFSNNETSVNVAFTQVAMPTEQEDMPEVEKTLSQQLQSTHPINFQSRIENINGFDYAVFEFESQAADSRIYNLMFATDIDGRLLLGSFNCTETLKNEWQPRAKEILASMRKG